MYSSSVSPLSVLPRSRTSRIRYAYKNN
jgi:hypothetical protein